MGEAGFGIVVLAGKAEVDDKAPGSCERFSPWEVARLPNDGAAAVRGDLRPAHAVVLQVCVRSCASIVEHRQRPVIDVDVVCFAGAVVLGEQRAVRGIGEDRCSAAHRLRVAVAEAVVEIAAERSRTARDRRQTVGVVVGERGDAGRPRRGDAADVAVGVVRDRVRRAVVEARELVGMRRHAERVGAVARAVVVVVVMDGRQAARPLERADPCRRVVVDIGEQVARGEVVGIDLHEIVVPCIGDVLDRAVHQMRDAVVDVPGRCLDDAVAEGQPRPRAQRLIGDGGSERRGRAARRRARHAGYPAHRIARVRHERAVRIGDARDALRGVVTVTRRACAAARG